MFEPVLNALPAFAMYFVTAMALLALFLCLYALITPYNELALIRAGNAAASASLGGAFIGIALPIAQAVVSSHNIYAMLGWGLVACAIQLLVFLVARLALPQLGQDIPANKPAAGIFLAALSIGVGIVNAACIV
jgi:putative membrane protein